MELSGRGDPDRLDLPLYFGDGSPGRSVGVSSRGHVTFAVEIRRRLDLQLASLNVAIQQAPTLQLQQILDFDGAGDLTHDIGLLAIDIALYDATRANDNFSRTVDIAGQGAVDTDVTVAGNIAFHAGARADQAGTGAAGGLSWHVFFGFSIEHIVSDFSRKYSLLPMPPNALHA